MAGLELPREIRDKQGRIYQVSGHQSTTGFLGLVVYKHHGVGRINWLIPDDANVLELADLIIFDQSERPRPLWAKVLPCLWRPPNFRGRGLGSAMLKDVIQQAELIGVEAIVGFVIPDDLRKTPYLYEFYTSHGFEVNAGGGLYRPVSLTE